MSSNEQAISLGLEDNQDAIQKMEEKRARIKKIIIYDYHIKEDVDYYVNAILEHNNENFMLFTMELLQKNACLNPNYFEYLKQFDCPYVIAEMVISLHRLKLADDAHLDVIGKIARAYSRPHLDALAKALSLKYGMLFTKDNGLLNFQYITYSEAPVELCHGFYALHRVNLLNNRFRDMLIASKDPRSLGEALFALANSNLTTEDNIQTLIECPSDTLYSKSQILNFISYAGQLFGEQGQAYYTQVMSRQDFQVIHATAFELYNAGLLKKQYAQELVPAFMNHPNLDRFYHVFSNLIHFGLFNGEKGYENFLTIARANEVVLSRIARSFEKFGDLPAIGSQLPGNRPTSAQKCLDFAINPELARKKTRHTNQTDVNKLFERNIERFNHNYMFGVNSNRWHTKHIKPNYGTSYLVAYNHRRVNCTAEEANQRDHSYEGDYIKRNMLDSIRGEIQSILRDATSDYDAAITNLDALETSLRQSLVLRTLHKSQNITTSIFRRFFDQTKQTSSEIAFDNMLLKAKALLQGQDLINGV